jgi:CheY-like chemotaxis protein
MTRTKRTSAGTAPDGKGHLVMVVDSDANRRTYHAMILLRFDYRVRSAASAAEALQMIADDVPALVLAELDLPVMSGRDLLRCLRGTPRTIRVPVIALSANGDHMTEAWCLRDGFAACLKTPAGAEELYQSVQSALAPALNSGLRVHKKVPVVVNNVPLDCIEGECVSVISEHGMYIRTLMPHPPNTRVDVRIDLEGRTIAAEAVVLYCHRFGEGPFGEPGMGIKFARIASQDQEFLRTYIHNEVASQFPVSDRAGAVR